MPKFANTRKASFKLHVAILRLCLLVANFIACSNTADYLFKECELKSGPTKFLASSESKSFETQIYADLLLLLLMMMIIKKKSHLLKLQQKWQKHLQSVQHG